MKSASSSIAFRADRIGSRERGETLGRIVLLLLLAVARPATAAETANLLRNADFQDDWVTLVAQNDTLHWSYPYEYQGRRDYNPDGWTLRGSWEWRSQDAPPGERRLVVHGPEAEVGQRVNWIAVNDDRDLKGFPDAGGFPGFAAVRSRRPDELVRDLTFRVRVRGRAVPADAGSIEVALCPSGEPTPGDPFGTPTEPTVSAKAALPSGDFDGQWIEAKLDRAAWKKAADAAGGPNGEGWLLPALVRVRLRYAGASGEIQIERAELTDRASTAPNLLPGGGFENDRVGALPAGWSGPQKYRYFPPGHYYRFNTWHNEDFENRGRPAVDSLVVHGGRASLRMPVLAGDEMAVRSDAIALRQSEPRLVEVTAWVKTDRTNQLQIDAEDEKGRRLDGFDFVSKAITSIGTDDWRLVRQVFRPRRPIESLRLLLCVRGVNGYTLGGTADVPQQNVAGTVWWDDVRVTEPESTREDLAARKVATVAPSDPPPSVRLARLDLGEGLFAENVLSATLVNPGPAAELGVELRITSPGGKERRFAAAPRTVPQGEESAIRIPYRLDDPCPPYSERRLDVRVVDGGGRVVVRTEAALAGWTAPIALELGALYLRPEQKQLVRLNLGVAAATMAKAASVKLEIVRRRDGRVAASASVPATPRDLEAERSRIPKALRGDLTNLLVTDLDVGALPIEPFATPERRWIVRATLLDRRGRPVAAITSAPFARLAHPPPQPPITSVTIRANTVLVDGEPWIPWGAIYGFAPRYAGPAAVAADAVWDLHNLPAWSYYEGFGSSAYTRRENDLNSARDFPGDQATTPADTMQRLEERWKSDDLYTGTFFVVPSPGVFSLDALAEKAGGRDKLDAYLDFAAKAPMVVTTGPGFEESFGRFHAATPDDLSGLEKVVETMRARTKKPVMVGHGGAWNRFEFEKVPWFDVFDPETEPLHPANLQTDLFPLVRGREKAIWLRPQMYESVPYERWRFHTFVELMRGARGWQLAHGPSDASTLRGLHAEVESLKNVMASTETPPTVTLNPPMEHWSARRDGRTYVIAATTHAIEFGAWRWSDENAGDGTGRARVSEASLRRPSEDELERVVESAEGKWVVHGIDYLPEPREATGATRLAQRLRLDPASPPRTVAFVVKTGGRWRSLAGWGALDRDSLKRDLLFGYWFLRQFYANAVGFVGYDGRGLPNALAHLPEPMTLVGDLPEPGRWLELATPLERFGIADEAIEGIGFLHEGGRVFWGDTALVASDGRRDVVWKDSSGPTEAELRSERISIAGLAAGTRVRVLFEDREIVAGRGHFEDDFRGRDLYQRYGGARGYGDTPVSFHVYEIPAASSR